MSRRPKRRHYRDVHGIVLLDKPVGLSSNAVLQKLIHLFKARKGGHTGALDPLASGMLPVCLGEATKVSSYLLDADKHYRVTARLGIGTATGDAEGEIIEQLPVPVFDINSLQKTLVAFTGEILQVPPMYSALKRDGKPLYELARAGKTVERQPRPVSIRHISVLDFDETGFTLEVSCSKGTYIRTLVEDIAKAMGTVAHVETLRRTHVDPYESREMITFEHLERFAEEGLDRLDACLMPMDQALVRWPSVRLDQSQSRRIVHGAILDWSEDSDPVQCRMYSDQGAFLGLGEILDKRLYPRRLLAQTSEG
ncbi:MAG TPA: tRNA pseudouridine(55) synthase TruB [Gammaproteobacteria bacterium]|nr:tRNA pseudouridine(55) synthase TruB [Gammaproteobacteria bacterium]